MLKLPAIFQSGMIIQREKPFAVWGESAPQEEIIVQIQGNSEKSTADKNGVWSVVLPPMWAAEGETLTVIAGEEKLVYEDIAIGEVWIAAGQSNMEFHMRYEKHLQEEKEKTSSSRIRFFDVPEIAYDGQEQDFDYSRMGIWRKLTLADMEYFSAVGYYFQRELEQELDVPLGVIGCNWGGTTAAAWMNYESVKGTPWMEGYLKKLQNQDMEQYRAEQKNNFLNDRGNPFADAFSELMMPRTPSPEEIAEFFESAGNEMPDFENILLPHEIPGSLYEHMVKTIAPYSVRGVLWYQGESDDVPGCQKLYQGMLTALISDWRKLWNDNELPFLIVQLPGFEQWMAVESMDYPTIRQNQELVCKNVKQAYLCSISDAGEQMDIHPKDKRIVGHRLALLAFGHIYGRDILCDAPEVSQVRRDGKKIELIFAHAGEGLYLNQKENATDENDMKLQKKANVKIEALEISAGEKQLSYEATVQGAVVTLYLQEEPKEAIQIKFAQTNWYQVNLYNSSHIPAIPFAITNV